METWLLISSGLHFYVTHHSHFMHFAITHITVYVLFLVISYSLNMYISCTLTEHMATKESILLSWFRYMDILLYLSLCIVTVRPLEYILNKWHDVIDYTELMNDAIEEKTTISPKDTFSWLWVHIAFTLFHSTNFYANHYSYHYNPFKHAFHGCHDCYGTVTQSTVMWTLSVAQNNRESYNQQM